MDDKTSDSAPEELTPRAPSREDLISLCRELNQQEAKYIIIGGFAVMMAGYPRTTGDIDLLVEASEENESKVYNALSTLPDNCVQELEIGDLPKYTVIRVADEILIDLMAKASGIDYAEASGSISVHELEGVHIPFASPELLWRMKKNTHREKDRGDLAFLRQWFLDQGKEPPQ